MLLPLSLALAAEPAAVLSWRDGRGRLDIDVPDGFHVAPDAPTRLVVGTTELLAFGPIDGARFPVPGAGEVRLSLGVCTDGSTSCRMVELVGRVDGRRGRVVLAPPAPPAPAVAGEPSAVARIYDFTAVWCPPCNAMAAEVLHDPEDAALVGRWPIEAVDVDRPESWALKDRHAVTGYPTLVAVDADGAEVDRLVGYPGEAGLRSWLAALDREPPLHALVAGVEGLDGAASARAARRLAEAGHEEAARRHLAAAAPGEDRAVARLRLDGDAAEARWLLTNAPLGDWVYAALEAVGPEAWAVVPRLDELPPREAAGVLDTLADRADPEAARALRAAAVGLLLAARTGDPAHDRADVTFLADLHAGTGDLDDALALLDDYARRFPDEFTFDHAAARLLLDAGQAPAAEARARVALARAWGDQRLRAVQVLAKALAAQGRAAEAVAALEAELAALPAPAADVAVRTHRYRKECEDLRERLRAPPP